MMFKLNLQLFASKRVLVLLRTVETLLAVDLVQKSLMVSGATAVPLSIDKEEPEFIQEKTPKGWR